MKTTTTPVSNDIISHKYEYLAIFDGVNIIPNGDPDNENAPRYDEATGRTRITNMCVKSKIRRAAKEIENQNLLICPNQHISLQVRMESASGEAVVEKTKPDDPRKKKTLDAVLNEYWDARTFGAVLAQNYGTVHGPVQVEDAESVNVCELQFDTINRSCVSTEKEAKEKDRTMGRRVTAKYALFAVRITVTPHSAQTSGFTENDLAILERSIRRMFCLDQSSCRNFVFRKLIKFTHEHKFGNASQLKTLRAVKLIPKVNVPGDFDDYEMVLPENIPGVTVEVFDEYDA